MYTQMRIVGLACVRGCVPWPLGDLTVPEDDSFYRSESEVSAMQPPDLTVPKDDKFYDPPQSLLEGEHGELIWSRPLSGEARPRWRSNELVLYSLARRPRQAGRGLRHHRPASPACPEGRLPDRELVHGTVGCADTCALLRDTEVSPAHSFNKYPHAMLNAFLNEGWAVLMTDYEGLGTEGRHPYLLGESEAHGILDIVLAVRWLYPDRLSNRLAIVGHSQGGQAALFGAPRADLDTRSRPARRCRPGPRLGGSSPRRRRQRPRGAAGRLRLHRAVPGRRHRRQPAHQTGGAPRRGRPRGVATHRYEGPDRAEPAGLLGRAPGIDQLNPEPNPSRKAFFDQLELMNPALRILAPFGSPRPRRISASGRTSRGSSITSSPR